MDRQCDAPPGESVDAGACADRGALALLGKRLLVVDRSPAFARSVARFAGAHGAAGVAYTADPAQALRALEERHIDLLLVEWTGWTARAAALVRRAKRCSPGTRVIALVLGESGPWDGARMAGADDVCGKEVLDEALGAAGPARRGR